jgi:CubicO group peptidase (beta-lactamase class C family)
MFQKESFKTRGSSDVSYQGKSVDAMISEFMDKHDVPGLTLAIVQAPYIPRVAGYGLSDAVQKRLATPNTVWPAGNISQAFLAVAVMQCYENELLDLNDNVGKYFPNLPKEWAEITVLQLLRHSTGLSDYRNNPQWVSIKNGSFEDLCGLVGEKLRFEPGYDVEMSATNSLILTEIIEKVTGTLYEIYVHENQINYLGLQHKRRRE